MATVLYLESDMLLDLPNILEETGERIISGQTSGDVLQEVIHQRPDVTFLADYAEPVEGVDLLAVVRRMTDKAIVVIGNGDENRQAQQLLEGADVYLRLPLRPLTVTSRLTSLLRPRKRVEPTVEKRPKQCSRPIQPMVRTYDLRLSPTESRLLVALLNRAGTIVPAAQLASDVWGAPTKLDSVRFYVSQLRSKLADHSTLSIRNQKGLGYRLDVEAGPAFGAR